MDLDESERRRQAAVRARFEKEGEAKARLRLQSGAAGDDTGALIDWLAEKDAAQARERASTERCANVRDNIAATAAIIAAIAAVFGAVISFHP